MTATRSLEPLQLPLQELCQNLWYKLPPEVRCRHQEPMLPEAVRLALQLAVVVDEVHTLQGTPRAASFPGLARLPLSLPVLKIMTLSWHFKTSGACISRLV